MRPTSAGTDDQYSTGQRRASRTPFNSLNPESFLQTSPIPDHNLSSILPGNSTMQSSSGAIYPSRVSRHAVAEAVEEIRRLRESWLRAEEGWKSTLGAAQVLKQKLIIAQSELAERDALIEDLQEEKDRMEGSEGSLKQQLDNEKKVTARATSLLADINEKLAMTMAERSRVETQNAVLKAQVQMLASRQTEEGGSEKGTHETDEIALMEEKAVLHGGFIESEECEKLKEEIEELEDVKDHFEQMWRDAEKEVAKVNREKEALHEKISDQSTNYRLWKSRISSTLVKLEEELVGMEKQVLQAFFSYSPSQTATENTWSQQLGTAAKRGPLNDGEPSLDVGVLSMLEDLADDSEVFRGFSRNFERVKSLRSKAFNLWTAQMQKNEHEEEEENAIGPEQASRNNKNLESRSDPGLKPSRQDLGNERPQEIPSMHCTHEVTGGSGAASYNVKLEPVCLTAGARTSAESQVTSEEFSGLRKEVAMVFEGLQEQAQKQAVTAVTFASGPIEVDIPRSKDDEGDMLNSHYLSTDMLETKLPTHEKPSGNQRAEDSKGKGLEAGPKLPLDQESAHLFVRAFLKHMIHKAGEEFYVVCKAVEGHPATDASDKTVLNPSNPHTRPNLGPVLPQKRKSRDEEASRSPGNESKTLPYRGAYLSHNSSSPYSSRLEALQKKLQALPVQKVASTRGSSTRAGSALPRNMPSTKKMNGSCYIYAPSHKQYPKSPTQQQGRASVDINMRPKAGVARERKPSTGGSLAALLAFLLDHGMKARNAPSPKPIKNPPPPGRRYLPQKHRRSTAPTAIGQCSSCRSPY